MGHVTVSIAGRSYRMACGDGEESHLKRLAENVDEKIAELKRSFGEIGDGRITVMAALTFADELSEARRRLASLESEFAVLREAQQAAEARSDDWSESVLHAVLHAAGRIENVSQSLGSAPAKEPFGLPFVMGGGGRRA